MSDALMKDLGIVIGKLEKIEQSMERADDHRSAMRDDVHELRSRTERLEEDMKSVQPFLEKAQKWEQRGVGAAFVLTAMGAVFGSMLTGFKEKIFTVFGWS